MNIVPNYKEKRSWLEVDLDQITRNYRAYRERLPQSTRMMVVTKADAYGHGDTRIAMRLIREGVDLFAVSNIDEAMVLRDAGVECEILILGYTSPQHAKTLYTNNITQTIVSEEHAAELISTGYPLRCHVAIDTGMNRIGIDGSEPEACEAFIRQISGALQVTGLFTHLAVADSREESDVTFTERQLQQFQAVARSVSDLRLPYVHCLNSAGGLAYSHDPRYADIAGIVRLGIVLYGLHPSDEVTLPDGVKPAATWKSLISRVKTLAPGQSVSYGRTYVADRPMRLATIPTGYADGYSRLLSNRGHVLIDGKRAPIVGRICMDQMMVDVTDIPEARMGTEVVLLGASGALSYTADDMASDLGTIGYEVMCNVSKRVQHYYV